MFVDLTSEVQALFQNSFFFLSTLSHYIPMGRDVARRDPVHVSPKVKLCMLTMLFKSVTPKVCQPKYTFLAFFLA